MVNFYKKKACIFFYFAFDIFGANIDNSLNKNSNGGKIVERLKELEQTIGYEFSNKNLLLQAFTLQEFEVFVIKALIPEDYELKENDDPNFFNVLVDKKSQWDEIKVYDFCYERLEFLGDSVLDFLAVERIRNTKIGCM